MTAPARILIVEDESIVAMDLQERLEMLGYHVLGVADTGEEAIRYAREDNPDLILMDIRLKGQRRPLNARFEDSPEGYNPCLDGIQVAEAIRQFTRIPVIFLTANADEATVNRASNTDGFGYLLKPFREATVHATIQMALKHAESERRLRQSERRYASTVRGMSEGVVTVDQDGCITLLNPAAERLTGWREVEARGRPVEEVLILVQEDTRVGIECPLRQALRENRVAKLPGICLLLTRDGREIPVEDSAVPLWEDELESPHGAVLAFRDISDRREAEGRVRQAERLASLSVLSGGIAHDFNNLLTPILGYASLAKESLPTQSPVAPMLHQIERAARNAAELSHQMRASSGQAILEKQALDLSDLVREVVEAQQTSRMTKVQWQCTLPQHLPEFRGDPILVRQLVKNLLTNSLESLEERSGIIQVYTSAELIDHLPLEAVGLQEPFVPGLYLRLEVSDTGCGMNEATLARIFDPFFSTKFQGRGLGMAAVYGIVQSHGGFLCVHSLPGRGTSLRVYFPGIPHRKSTPAPLERSEAKRTHPTILFADDEPGVRALVREVFERAGLDVVLVEDGRAAVDRFFSEPERFSLVVLDLMMPGLNGHEVMRVLRAQYPQLPLLLISGFSADEASLPDIPGNGAIRLMAKPFSPKGLLTQIRELLSGS